MGTTNAEVQETQPETHGQKPCSYCPNCAIAVDDGIVFCSTLCSAEWAKFHPKTQGTTGKD